ncbi:helix-hairpin-helix domain-containing protein [Bacillus pumilus]|uniref:Competence protein ComEA n=1 Tax=Bacillus pumilus (strain SAFR-032) TaxID=315750 RepID=A8FFE5_BACP2|nr:helix-hairpin-helix domain-containing protein [Bacillus pumilus]ABV62962.1 competence protein ComEA [Bacillus pumilus SAFR-032]MBC3641789.1 helix-hairpin-helix domain-containing protein [Bacillus pumilus]MBC3645106.1 helix-hairpin-helix domain-containing protein [Bacillus pumilus]MBC3649639.1 helix-hairpin-helix domain-containing protein [Bacillus pumilus]MBC3653074.1 helix-hairpin-helix domain-containing protein [Bacillus pumilus]
MKRLIPLRKYSLYIGAGLISAIIITFFLLAGNKGSTGEPSVLKGDQDKHVTLEDKTEKPDNDSSSIFVEVKGAVKKPGVYTFQSDARVEEAIRRAGGFTSKADTIEINQAAKLEDSMMIYVRKQGEAERQTQTAGADAPSGNEKSQSVNVNQADAAELQTINGIGPAKAEAIITYREEHGEFQQIEDLRNISGFGEKTIERLKNELTVK